MAVELGWLPVDPVAGEHLEDVDRQAADLHGLLEQRLSLDSSNPVAKATCVMLAGADCIDDLDLLRHAGMGRILGGL